MVEHVLCKCGFLMGHFLLFFWPHWLTLVILASASVRSRVIVMFSNTILSVFNRFTLTDTLHLVSPTTLIKVVSGWRSQETCYLLARCDFSFMITKKDVVYTCNYPYYCFKQQCIIYQIPVAYSVRVKKRFDPEDWIKHHIRYILCILHHWTFRAILEPTKQPHNMCN